MPAGEVRAAVIVATNKYQDQGLRQLRAPASDARELARILQDDSIGAFSVQTLIDQPHQQVLEELEGFFREDRRRDDLLLLYFSCHGVKDDDGRLYFATANTKRNRLDSTAIPADWIAKQMDHSPSNRIVLILDCCYTGGFARSMKGDPTVGLKERLAGQGRVVLTASNAIEYSFEGDQPSGSTQPSIFTGALVHGLETGEADTNGDGLVDVDELYDYVFSKVRESTPNQTPKKWVDVEGEFFLARNKAGPRPKELPADLQTAIGNPYAAARQAAVGTLAGLLQSTDPGLSLAARSALERLAADDSRTVSAAAKEAMGGPTGGTQGLPPQGGAARQRPDAERKSPIARSREALRLLSTKARSVVGSLKPRISRRVALTASAISLAVLVTGTSALLTAGGRDDVTLIEKTTGSTGLPTTSAPSTTIVPPTESTTGPPPVTSTAPTTGPTASSGPKVKTTVTASGVTTPPTPPPSRPPRTPTADDIAGARLRLTDLDGWQPLGDTQEEAVKSCGKAISTQAAFQSGIAFITSAHDRSVGGQNYGYAGGTAAAAMRELQEPYNRCTTYAGSQRPGDPAAQVEVKGVTSHPDRLNLWLVYRDPDNQAAVETYEAWARVNNTMARIIVVAVTGSITQDDVTLAEELLARVIGRLQAIPVT